MTEPFLPVLAKIIAIRSETADKLIKTFTLSIQDKADADRFDFLPGQFIELFLPGKGEFPVGIASAPAEKGIIEITVKKTGLVTTYLHTRTINDNVGIRGPFGRPFPWQGMSGKNVVLIGGGFAFTTLRAALQYILNRENRPLFKDIHVVYGATNPELLLYRAELEQWAGHGQDIQLHLTVDRTNGMAWHHETGLVPEIVRQRVPTGSADTVALVCGPPIMVKFTIPVLDALGYRHDQVFLSLENKMKCGVGLCGRCNIGPVYICKDGPVFSLEKLNQLPDEY
ncbi:FAD/NAD(P)-binding protein [bacterium]|nr:FAD/NAD(P)-binding protein [bacterium]